MGNPIVHIISFHKIVKMTQHLLGWPRFLVTGLCCIGLLQITVPGEEANPWKSYTFRSPPASIATDSLGNVWIATAGGVRRFSGGFKTFRETDGLSSNRVHVVYADGDVLVGTDKGANKFIGETFTRFPEDGGLEGKSVRAIAQGRDEVYWFGTDDGLFNSSEKETYRVGEAPEAAKSVHRIYKDSAGDLWFSTASGLLRRRHPSGKFELYTSEEGLPSNQVYCLYEADAGLLVGTSQGLVRLEDTTFTNFPAAAELDGYSVQAIYENHGIYWFGASNGIWKYDGRQLEAVEPENIPFTPQKVTAIVEDLKGRLWFGTDDRYLARYHLESSPPNEFELLIEQAQETLRDGQWQVAIDKFKDANNRNPNKEDVKRGLIEAYIGLVEDQRQAGQLPKARETVEEARRLYPGDLQIERVREKILVQIEQSERLDRIESAYDEGLDHLGVKRWTRAVSKFNEVLGIDPEHPGANENRLKAYLGHFEQQRDAGELAEARRILAEAQKLYPKNQRLSAELQELNTRVDRARRRAQAEKAVSQGLSHLRARRCAEAIAKFKEARTWVPDLSEASLGLKKAYVCQGRAQLKKEQWDPAIENFNKALKIDKSDQAVVTLLKEAEAGKFYSDGMMALVSKDWVSAVRNFQKVLNRNPQYKDASERLVEARVRQSYEAGIADFENGEFQKAIENFETVLQAENSFRSASIGQGLSEIFSAASERVEFARAEVLFETGKSLFDRGDYGVARTQLEQVLRIDPEHQRARVLLAKIGDEVGLLVTEENLKNGERSLDRGEWERAIAYFDAALLNNPDDVRARKGRQQALMTIAALEARKKRVVIVESIIAVLSFLAIVYLWSPIRRAGLYASLGIPQRAAQVYENLMARNPTNASVLLALAAVRKRLGQQARVAQLYENYLRLVPDDLVVLNEAGNLHFERGQHPQALQKYHRILKSGRGTNELFKQLLQIHDQMDVSDSQTQELYERALHSEPESAPLNRLLSRLYLKAGRSDEHALKVYRCTLESQPENLALRLMSAIGYLEEDHFEEAIEEAKQILGHSAGNREALSVLLSASHRDGSLNQALASLESYQLAPLTALAAYEGIVELEPEYRQAVDERYRKIAEGLTEKAPERDLYLAHLTLSKGETEKSANYLERAYHYKSKSEAYRRELIQAYQRLLAQQEEEIALEPALRAGLVFRLGELQRQQGDWRQALSSFQQTRLIPEWNIRSVRASRSILDALPTKEVAAISFEDVNWQVDRFSSEDGSNLIVTPVQPFEKKIYSDFQRCQVKCFERMVTVDDIVQLRNELERQKEVNRDYTFIIVPIRPRQEIYALIYALIGEKSSLRIIPLELASLKQAIIDLDSAGFLDQIIRLWVGEGDLYDIHNPITDAATFFGRGKFINRLTTKIMRRQNFGIFGSRKIGKTSLIFQLRETLPAILIAYVDLQSISSQSCEETYFRLSEALRHQVRVKYPSVPLPSFNLRNYDPREQYPNVATDFHNDLLKLKEAFEGEGKVPPVLLLLDEIELAIPHGESLGFRGYDDFFRQVRGLYQQEGFVVSAVVGADPTLCRAAKWGDRDNPVFQYYDEVFLTPLERSECDQMVQGIGEIMGISYDPASLRLIYEESGGHPYVARQLCSRIVNRFRDRPLNVDEEMLHEAIEDYIAQRPDYFVGVFRGYLSGEARKILEAAAESEQNKINRDELIALADEDGFGREALERALQDLELFQFLVRVKSSYQMKIRLMRRWIRHSWLGVE